MRILILNQYAPPDEAPTAKLVGHIAQSLAAAGHRVTIVGANQSYRRKISKAENRIIRELSALAEIFYRAVRSRNPELILSTSSPPGLLVIATLLALIKRARSVHWALDLYPELALILGRKLPPFLQRLLYWVTGVCYRRITRVVTLDADMQRHISGRYGVLSEVIRPWLLNDNFPAEYNYPPKEEFTWLYSGNLGRAHEWRTLLEAQRILEERKLPMKLVFQGGGPEWSAAQAHAQSYGLRQVEWRTYVPESQLIESLLQAHVMVVTQKDSVQGLLWPSKLTLVMCLPRPLLFVGPATGSIAAELTKQCSAAVFAPGSGHAIANYLVSLYKTWPPLGRPQLRPAFMQSEAESLWRELVAGLAQSGPKRNTFDAGRACSRLP
jgi:colanic acid biosynthesis glycosyl transferase WcaI